MADRARPEIETLQRVRRIETRLTQFMIAQGVTTGAQQPAFDPGNIQGRATVVVPSRHSTLAEVVGAIPPSFVGPVDVMISGELIATLDRSA